MPHLIVECSKNAVVHFAMRELLADLHHAIDGLHNIALERVKTRAYVADDFIVGADGQTAAFMHINLKLLPGRSDGQKSELSAILQEKALAYLMPKAEGRVILTVEISELHPASYRA